MFALWHRVVAWFAAFGRHGRLSDEPIHTPNDTDERKRIEAQVVELELQLYDIMQINMARSAKRLNEQ